MADQKIKPPTLIHGRTVANNNVPIRVDASGVVQVNSGGGGGGGPTTGDETSVPASASSVTLLAANVARLGAVIVNDSTDILYVKFGTTASTSSFTYLLPGLIGGLPSQLELPSPAFAGRIDGIWSGTNGNARITEIS